MAWFETTTPYWSKLRGLSWSERIVLGQSLMLLPLTALALRCLGFKRWQATTAKLVGLKRARPVWTEAIRVRHARVLARMVAVAANHGVYRASCLEQSLTLWWLLRRRGIDSQIRIGVRKEADRLEAHAWVEFAGVVLNDHADVHERYACFARDVAPVDVRGS